LIFDQLGFFFS